MRSLSTFTRTNVPSDINLHSLEIYLSGRVLSLNSSLRRIISVVDCILNTIQATLAIRRNLRFVDRRVAHIEFLTWHANSH